MEKLSEHIRATKNLPDLELVLAEALYEVDLIGELEINADAYACIVKLLQREGTFRQLGEPCTYIVSMVFSARYDEDATRKFWQPYLDKVWRKSNSQSNYNTARENYREAKAILKQTYGFNFPIRSQDGDVVHAIYWHAIIPAYLQDDFAFWLAPKFNRLFEMSPDEIKDFINSESATAHIAPRLQKFLQSDNEIALHLIEELLLAYYQYLESEDPQFVYESLSSPIYQDIWEQLVPIILDMAKDSVPRTSRTYKTRLEWAWSFDEDEWVLRFINLTTPAHKEPRFCIWSSQPASTAFRNNYAQHDLWAERIEGQWRVAERVLGSLKSRDMLDSKVYLYDRNDVLIQEYRVPLLPDDEYLVLRMTQQRQYAIPMQRPYTFIDGDYLMSYHGAFSILHEGQVLPPQREYTARVKTASSNDYRLARYELQLPFHIESNGHSEEYDARESRQVRAEITGDNRLESLAIDVPPVFTGKSLRLIFSYLPARYTSLQLVIRGSSRPKHLLLKNYLVQTSKGYEVDLSPHINLSRIGNYEIDVTYNLQSRLPAPIQFSILPGIEVQPPIDRVYNPLHLPQVDLKQVRGEIVIPDKAEQEQQGEMSRIIWSEFKDGVLHLKIHEDDTYVPLAWRVKRVAAWFEQTTYPDLLQAEDLQQARLEIRGESGQHLAIRVGQDVREITLNAKGSFGSLVRYDPLIDMLNQTLVDDSELYVESYGERWLLASFIRRPRVISLHVEYFAELGIHCQLELSADDANAAYLLQILNSQGQEVAQQPVANFKSIDIEKILPPDTYSVHLLRNDLLLTMPDNNQFVVVPPSVPFFMAEYTDSSLSVIYQIENEAAGKYWLELIQHGKHLRRDEIFAGSNQCSIEYSLNTEAYTLRLSWNDMVIFEETKAFDTQIPNGKHEQDKSASVTTTKEQLYKSATLSPDILQRYSPEAMYRRWRPLRRLAELHHQPLWLLKYGMIPSWTVIDKSVRFTTKGGKSYFIYPEKVIERGTSGIGKIALNLPDIQYAYARWTGETYRSARLQVWIPSTDLERQPYSAIDEMDMRPAYYDTQAGDIRGSRTRYLIPGKQLNGGFLVDMVHNYQCDGFLDFKNHGLIHTLNEYDSIDREFTAACLSDAVPEDEFSVKNIIVPEGYRYAVMDWLMQWRKGGDAKTFLRELVSPQLSSTFEDYINVLKALDRRENSPYLKGVMRFLQGMENQVRTEDYQKLMRLDRHIFLLCVALRVVNLPTGSLRRDMREALRLADEDIITYLWKANHACPAMLEWGLTWAEILFVHSAS
jgi:hypothetical protein